MKIFKPTFLYIKQHNITGLLYFGKTVKNPEKYDGSGVYWKNHLKKYGNDITNVWYCLFLDESDLKEFALNFSLQQNIVNATDSNGKKIWANYIIENGLDGGSTPKEGNGAYGKKYTYKKLMKEETKLKISNGLKEHYALYGPPVISHETRKKISETMLKNGTTKGENNYWYGVTGENNPRYGIPRKEETKKKISEAVRGENNGMFGKQHKDTTKNIWKENKRNCAEKNGMFGKTGELNPLYGIPRSEETKKKLSEKLRGKPQEKVKCPHCGKEGGITVMPRWHFDNCKSKNDSQTLQ